MGIAKEGLPFIFVSGGLAVAAFALGWWFLGAAFALFAAAFSFFFRDPKRALPPGEHLVLSPADGKVLGVDSLPGYSDVSGPVTRITIFLSILDVHLVRSPLTAKVRKIDSQPGKFLPAYREESGAENASRTLVLDGKKRTVVLKKIVGVAARRIKCFVREKDTILRGQKIGLMYFGSRVEIYLPQDTLVKIALNQKVKGGKTVIAEVEP
jgi:phosphatidylserine decarboxylase